MGLYLQKVKSQKSEMYRIDGYTKDLRCSRCSATYHHLNGDWREEYLFHYDAQGTIQCSSCHGLLQQTLPCE